jgi:hypothetical protein
MAIDKIHLRKLLQLFRADPRQRRSLLLADIRSDLSRQAGAKGGDFHSPFWADAKDHVAGVIDLREKTKTRVESNPTRKRLYPMLSEGFLKLWTDKVRWRNEKFEFVPTSVGARFEIKELGAVVKVENVVAVQLQDGSNRIVYPYFSERPSLSVEEARLGFWAIGQALPEFAIRDFRIVDVLRASYFRSSDSPLRDNDRETFIRRYDSVLQEWRRLRDER